MAPLINRSVISTGVIALALLISACAGEDSAEGTQSAERSGVESPADNSTDAEATAPTESDEPSESFEEEELDGTLVSSFPDAVPLYPSEVVNSLAAVSEVTERPEWNVLLTTGDAFEEVDAAIRSDYTSNGWNIRSEMDYMGGFLLVAGKDEYTVSITYHELSETEIHINYGVSS